MVLKQKRDNSDILIIDASKDFIKVGKNNKLRASDIKKITDTISDRKSVHKYAKLVTKEEIRKNEYNLNIPRYVDSTEKAESYDIYASMFGGIPVHEIEELNHFWDVLPKLRNELFIQDSSKQAILNTENIKETVMNHSSVKLFKDSFKRSFKGFRTMLKTELLNNIMTVNREQGEEKLSSDIFTRLKNVELIDKYNAYQILDDEWVKIVVDLEIVHTEGFEATKQVNPNMVVKKRKGKSVEVQEGWVGNVIPFDITQEKYYMK